MLFGVGYGCFCWQSTGGAQIVQEKIARVSSCLRMLVVVLVTNASEVLLAEYVPATMLDPKALGTAFQKKKVRMELHILTFIEQCSGLQGRRRCLAAGVLDIWHGTDPPDLGTARGVPVRGRKEEIEDLGFR